MRFRATIFTTLKAKDQKLPISSILEFTKSQIIFPKSFTNAYFQNSNIKHLAKYTLIVHDNIDVRKRYEIKINNRDIISIIPNKRNERKLKWIHKLYPIQKNDVAFYTLIVAAIGVLASIFLIIWQLLK